MASAIASAPISPILLPKYCEPSASVLRHAFCASPDANAAAPMHPIPFDATLSEVSALRTAVPPTVADDDDNDKVEPAHS